MVPRYPQSIEELAANIRQSSLPGYAKMLLLANYGDGPGMDTALQQALSKRSEAERAAVTLEIFRVLGLTPTTRPEDR